MSVRLVSYRYTDGRTRPRPGRVITIGADRVKELLDREAPIEVVDGFEHLGLTPPEPDPEPAPEPDVAPEDEDDDGDGWPAEYSYEKTGGYVAVWAPDGEPVLSDTPSGKFKGENAAQEAAWKHKGAS